jgi:hypothetical protein
MTAVAGSIFTAAQYNANVRDNLNETAPAKATAASQFFVATGPNAIAARSLLASTVLTSETTAATSYTNLATIGPVVTVSTGPTVMVMFSADIDNTVVNGASSASVAVSGASVVAASNNWRICRDGLAAGNKIRFGTTHLFTGLTPGSNTFTMQYLVGSGTGTFDAREMIVLPC